MNQPELWDSPTFARAVRNTDPATSKLAAERLRSLGRDDSARRQMWEAFKLRPMTAEEAAAYCHRQLGGRQDTYRKRSGELKAAGFVRVVGHRRCKETNQVAEVLEAVI